MSSYQKLLATKESHNYSSAKFKQVKSELDLLENYIKKRIELSTEPLMLEDFFIAKKLNTQEQIIFLALLKDEYSSGEYNLRDMNTLISLISFNDYDKMKNRELFEENSRLIEQDIIEYSERLTHLGEVIRLYFLSTSVFYEVMHHQKKKKRNVRGRMSCY